MSARRAACIVLGLPRSAWKEGARSENPASARPRSQPTGRAYKQGVATAARVHRVRRGRAAAQKRKATADERASTTKAPQGADSLSGGGRGRQHDGPPTEKCHPSGKPNHKTVSGVWELSSVPPSGEAWGAFCTLRALKPWRVLVWVLVHHSVPPSGEAWFSYRLP